MKIWPIIIFWGLPCFQNPFCACGPEKSYFCLGTINSCWSLRHESVRSENLDWSIQSFVHRIRLFTFCLCWCCCHRYDNLINPQTEHMDMCGWLATVIIVSMLNVFWIRVSPFWIALILLEERWFYCSPKPFLGLCAYTAFGKRMSKVTQFYGIPISACSKKTMKLHFRGLNASRTICSIYELFL